jgi:prevent-host-death family protein
MRTAGIREVRQDLTSLLDDVRKGREVVITDRGRPIARIVPVVQRMPFPDLSAFRERFRERFGDLGVSLSQAVIDDRADSV